MGAGIAAVAGIENEPSSQRVDIEEAQAELRQELSGRSERRRELEFLEKGGDPLEFKFGEALPGVWSLSPADPLVNHLIPSDGRGSISDNDHKTEDNTDYNTEEGSESKRARGVSGKFCFLDHTATSISIEKALPATIISSSIEHDRKDPPRRELDACKSNKVAVKGQYARRNRQQSNRFTNGFAASRDSAKVGTEGGSSNSTTKGHVACDAEAKYVANNISAQPITTDRVALQSRSADVEACEREGQEKVSAALDLPEAATTVQTSSIHDSSEHVTELQACQPLLLEATREANATACTEKDEGPQSMDQLSSDDGEKGRDAIPCMGGEGKNLLLSLPCDSQDKDSSIMESTHDLFPSGTNENKVAFNVSTNSSLDSEILTYSKNDISEAIHVAGSDKANSAADKTVINDHTSASPVHVTRNLLASECRERLDTETSASVVETSASVVESVNPAFQLTSESCISEKKVQANKDDLLEREINTNGLCGKAQRLEEVKVKVEHETPDAAGSLSVSRANLSPLNASNSQEAGTLQLQSPGDGGMNSGCNVAKGLQLQATLLEAIDLPPDKLPVAAMPQDKIDLRSLADSTKDVKTNLNCAAKTADDDLAAQEAERMKQDSLRDGVELAKQRTFQEPPRKKSHWDFVLEEMAWLANDFMQERLWKIAAAAQIARWVVKEKQQIAFEEMEVHNRQLKVAQSLAKAVKKFWHSVETLLLKDNVGADNTPIDEAQKTEAGIETVEPIKNKFQARPVQTYALRFLKDSSGRQSLPQAEAPHTPDRVSESGIFDFWEEQFSEERFFYTVPKNAMEVYRQSVVSQWEGEYEQRLQEHEAALAEMEVHAAGEAMEYSSGTYAVGPLVSPLVTGKRSSGFLGVNQTNRGSIPTKRMRTSAARQRAAGGTGPLVSIPVAHLTRSDISSCETNSQQDEMTALLEGSSVSGRATDVDSNGAFVRTNLAVDGVDSPFKSKKKKKTRHFSGGHAASAGCDRESEQVWQHNSHRQSEQKEQLKQKGEQAGIGSSGLEGLGATTGAYHGAASVTTSSANKLIKQITSRDRGRKYKGGKASLNQPGLGIPWSPVEDQAILGLVYELGLNWELVSDILSSNSQLKGIFRKPKDCKERYRMLTDRLGGDGGDSPDDPSSSAHLSISKGGTRFLPQHLEETLKSHVDCILQLHQQLRSRKLQSESQEPKQLVPEHESHGIKQIAMTPLELCELSSTSGDLVSHTYPIQPAHGNGLGIPSMLSPGVGMRPTSSAMSALQGTSNLQMSPISPSAALNAAATRDALRMGASMRPLAAEDQRLRYSRMVAGRGLQTQALSVTSGSPLMNLPNATDCTAPPSLPSGNNAGMMCSLSRGLPVTRTGLPGMGPVGVPNISAGMNNALPSVGMGVSGAGAVVGAVSSPVSMMRRPTREAISMGHSPSAALTNVNGSLPNTVVSSPTQNFGAQQQQQLLQHNTLPSQQQSPSSSQQQAYNMMRVAKERQQLQQQQLQQQQQKRMLQQQQSPTNNVLQSPFQSSQPLPASQQQHGLSPHAHLFSQQHQPSHLLMQQHTMQESGTHQQHTVPQSSIPQSAVSPSGQPSLSGNSQNSQQQQSLSQVHHPSSTASSTQPPFQNKHHSLSSKQQPQQQQAKNGKGIGRGEGQPNMLPSQVPAQISGQQMSQGQRMGDSQGTLQQHLAGGGSCPQNVPANSLQGPDGGVQQFQQKGFPHLPGKHISTCPPVQPTSPPSGGSAAQQQPSPGPIVSLPSTQHQRRAGQQSQSQQRRPQQSQAGTQLASQSGKSGLQPSSVPPQLPVGFQLGSNTNSPLSMTSPSGGVPLSLPSNTGSGGFPSPQWKPAQNFTPMAAGLYNLSRTNSGIAAQAPHLAISVGMQLPLSNGKLPVTGNSLVTQDISRGGSQHVTGHVGILSQKASVGSAVNSRAVPVSQHAAPSPRQLTQQQQLSCTLGSTGGQQLRPASSGTAPAPE